VVFRPDHVPKMFKFNSSWTVEKDLMYIKRKAG